MTARSVGTRKEHVVGLLLGLLLQATLIVPLITFGPREVWSILSSFPQEAEFGSPAACYLMLVFVLSLPLYGTYLFAGSAKRIVTALTAR
jgi:hypothetical protein